MTFAILIEGHGSGVGMESAVEVHANKLKEHFGDRVRIGYSRLGKPSIEESVEQIVRDGYTKMVVVPMFYAPGWFTDGNTMKRFNVNPATRHGSYLVGSANLEVFVTRMFITDERMNTIVSDIVASHSDKSEGILLLGHGSKDGRNLRISLTFKDILVSRGYDVECCSNEFDHPDLEEGVGLLAPRHKKIIILPMFVSPSNHTRVEIPEKLGIDAKSREGDVQSRNGTVHVAMLDELGLCPEITPILADLIGESGF